jgi:hypothetical protein
VAQVTVRANVRGKRELRRISRNLRQTNRGLQRKCTAEIRKAGQPALAAVRSAFMGVDIASSGGGGGSTGLRARVAAATKITPIAQGIKIKIYYNQVDPAYGRTLASGVDGELWRHPVFGNRRVWTFEVGEDTFYPTLEQHADEWADAAERVLDWVESQLGF